ncbi:MAG: hypothetical protein HY547_04735 [Elusimicrobia bacterium]|nr:hypothetical protein [Elusimicrobiota bacterium]
MKFLRKFTPFAVCFFGLMGALHADESETPSVHVLYMRGQTYGTNGDIGFAFESWLSSQSGRAQLVSIELGRAYCSGSRCLIDAAAAYQWNQLPSPQGPFKEMGFTEILETPRVMFWVSSSSAGIVLDEISALIQNPASDAHVPGLTRRKVRWGDAEGSRGESLKAFEISGSTSSPGWSSDLLMKYRILWDGREADVFILAKSWGGASRVKTAFRDRANEIDGPKVKILTGQNFIGLGDNHEALWDGLKELDFDFWIPHYSDFESHWHDLRPYLMGTEKSSSPLLLSNLTASGSTVSVTMPWGVIEADGARIGIFSLLPENLRDIFRSGEEPFDVAEPIHWAHDAVSVLRGQERVDAVICVSYLKSEDDARLRHEVGGIDVLIGEFTREIATSRRTTVELGGWSKEIHGAPALHAMAPAQGFGEIELHFQRHDGRYELSRLEERSEIVPRETPRDPELVALEEEMIQTYVSPQEKLLPDARELWPSAPFGIKRTYDALEFWNLAAHAMREETRSEMAFIRIHPLDSRAPGPVGTGFVQEWLGPDQKILIYQLPGSLVRSFFKRAVFESVPVNPNSADQRRYRIKTLLAAAGINARELVNGLALDDSEFYQVAIGEDLLGFPDFRDIPQSFLIGAFGLNLSNVVTGWLRRQAKEFMRDPAHYQEIIRNSCQARDEERSLWRLHLREMNLQFSNTQVRGADPYVQVSDARIQATNQIFLRGTARLFSEYSYHRWRWDTGLTADYGRVTLSPAGGDEIRSETVDQAIAQTDFVYRMAAARTPFGEASMGPFLNFSYDTEWTRPDESTGLARRAFGRMKTGAKLYEGRYLRELSAGALWQRDYSKTIRDDDVGWEGALTLAAPLPKTPVTAQLTASIRQLDNDPNDDAADLRQEISARVQLKVPFWGRLNLSPFVDIYRFQGQHNLGAGTNIIFGFGLEFSRLWKPVF